MRCNLQQLCGMLYHWGAGLSSWRVTVLLSVQQTKRGAPAEIPISRFKEAPAEVHSSAQHSTAAQQGMGSTVFIHLPDCCCASLHCMAPSHAMMAHNPFMWNNTQLSYAAD